MEYHKQLQLGTLVLVLIIDANSNPNIVERGVAN